MKHAIGHSELIDALGGTSKVATLCSRDMASVSIWRKKGIPWMMRPFIVARAEEIGADIPDGFLDPIPHLGKVNTQDRKVP